MYNQIPKTGQQAGKKVQHRTVHDYYYTHEEHDNWAHKHVNNKLAIRQVTTKYKIEEACQKLYITDRSKAILLSWFLFVLCLGV